MTILTLMFLLITKHLLVDFFWQFPYQYQNKGKYGHLGGISHAFAHGCFTFMIFFNFGWKPALILSLFDAITHYHIDWAKVNICNFFGWKMTKDRQYWWMLGIDQFLHMAVYLMLCAGLPIKVYLFITERNYIWE